MRILLTRLIRRVLSWPTRRLNAQDARAYNRGWTITSGRFGSRTYRDPRWDDVEALRAAHLRDETMTIDVPAADPHTDIAPAPRDAHVVAIAAATR